MSSRASRFSTRWKRPGSRAGKSRASPRRASLAGSGFPLRTANREYRPILESHRGKAAAPHASAIEREEIVAHPQAERGPVAADDGVIAAAACGNVEPGDPFVARLARLALEAEHHGTVAPADAKARHGVDDE